jgi:hypothetical protein
MRRKKKIFPIAYGDLCAFLSRSKRFPARPLTTLAKRTYYNSVLHYYSDALMVPTVIPDCACVGQGKLV